MTNLISKELDTFLQFKYGFSFHEDLKALSKHYSVCWIATCYADRLNTRVPELEHLIQIEKSIWVYYKKKYNV